MQFKSILSVFLVFAFAAGCGEGTLGAPDTRGEAPDAAVDAPDATALGCDCPQPTFSAWGACEPIEPCSEMGERTRSVTRFACIDDICVEETSPESEPCTRQVDPQTCAETTCGEYEPCVFDATCEESGTQRRTCTTRTCIDGECTDETATETRSCERDTQGQACGQVSCDVYDGCVYSDPCSTTGVRTRTCHAPVCAEGACVQTTYVETDTCTRSVDAQQCSNTECGEYSACDYRDACDESAEQTRRCTTTHCVDGDCTSETFTETRACARDTDTLSCGDTSCRSWGSCKFGDGTCDETGEQSRRCTVRTCSAGQCVANRQDETKTCTRDTDGNSCGSRQCGSYGGCEYDALCSNQGEKTRNCTARSCVAGSCATTTETESRSCTRNTDGVSCGESSCEGTGTCLGFRDDCDASGLEQFNCTDDVCDAGLCATHGYASSRECFREVDEQMCQPPDNPDPDPPPADGECWLDVVSRNANANWSITAAELSAIEAALGPGTDAPTECSGTSQASWGMSHQEHLMLGIINHERAKCGKAPLQACASLAQAAQRHSADQRDRRYYAHLTKSPVPNYLDGPEMWDRMCAAGYAPACGIQTWMGEVIDAWSARPDTIVGDWMESPGHRAILMDEAQAGYRMIGIGYACGGSLGHYWTANVAAATHASCN